METNQDITFTITVPAHAVADILAAIASIPRGVAGIDYTAADAPMPGDEMMHALDATDGVAELAPITGRCGTCGAAYRWFPGERPPNHCACGGMIHDADDVLPPAPFGEVPGDIPFVTPPAAAVLLDRLQPLVDSLDVTLTDVDNVTIEPVAVEVTETDTESDNTAAAADTFAMWLSQREYVSPAASAAFDAQDSSGNWKSHLFAAGFEEWADGSWHRAPRAAAEGSTIEGG